MREILDQALSASHAVCSLTWLSRTKKVLHLTRPEQWSKYATCCVCVCVYRVFGWARKCWILTSCHGNCAINQTVIVLLFPLGALWNQQYPICSNLGWNCSHRWKRYNFWPFLVCNDPLTTRPSLLLLWTRGVWMVDGSLTATETIARSILATACDARQSGSLVSDQTVGSHLRCSLIICDIPLEVIVSLLPQMTHQACVFQCL